MLICHAAAHGDRYFFVAMLFLRHHFSFLRARATVIAYGTDYLVFFIATMPCGHLPFFTLYHTSLPRYHTQRHAELPPFSLLLRLIDIACLSSDITPICAIAVDYAFIILLFSFAERFRAPMPRILLRCAIAP